MTSPHFAQLLCSASSSRHQQVNITFVVLHLIGNLLVVVKIEVNDSKRNVLLMANGEVSPNIFPVEDKKKIS